MMKNILLYTGLIIAALIINSCSSCKDQQVVIDYDVVYPNADAVYLSMNKEYTLNPDGSVEYHYSHSMKLLTYLSFNRLYGESFIVYNPNQQDLEINKSETIMADGTIVPSPENAFNEVLPRSAANAPAYNHLREMVVTHTGLEIGATINLDYTINSKSGYFPALSKHDIFAQNSPVKELNITVNVPKGTSLNYALLNDSCAVTPEENGEFTSYHFHIEDIDALTGEHHIAVEELPQLIFSTTDYASLFEGLNTKHKLSQKAVENINIEIPELNAETKDFQTAMDIQKYVVNNINHYHVSLEHSGYKSRTTERVWNDNGGTTIEKTILLVDLLNKAGYDATLVGTVNTNLFDEHIGIFDLINNYYVQIKIDDATHYLSAISLSENDPEDKIIQINKSLNATEISYDLPNKITVNGEINIINKRYILGTIEAYFTNDFVPDRELLTNKKAANSLITKAVTNRSTILESTANELKVDYKLDLSGNITNQANYYFIDLPVSAKGVNSWHLNYLVSERETAFKLPDMLTEEYLYNIKVPAGLNLVTKEVSIEKTNSVGELIIEISPIENGQFSVHRKIKFNTSLVAEEDYMLFKDLLDSWNNDNNQQIILKK